MSLIKTIRHQLGLSVTPANNFTLDASADNGTMKLARGNAGATTQDVMTVDAAGEVDFKIGIFGFSYYQSGGWKIWRFPSWFGKLQIVSVRTDIFRGGVVTFPAGYAFADTTYTISFSVSWTAGATSVPQTFTVYGQKTAASFGVENTTAVASTDITCIGTYA